MVGITATTPLANQTRDISYVVKEVAPDVVTIAGGPHPAALPGQTLGQSALDLVAGGEADHDDRRPARRHGGPTRCPVSTGATAIDRDRADRPRFVENLDDLALPAWEIYPMEGNSHVTKLIARDGP